MKAKPWSSWVLIVTAVIAVSTGAGVAQQPQGNAPPVSRRYETNLANENWSFLQDPAAKTDFWDPVKYIDLRKENWYLTLGGEIRISPQGFRIRGQPQQPSIIDNYLLQRYLLSVDLHMGPRFRVFTELQSGIISGRFDSPRPTDKDLLEPHQAFFEYRSAAEKKRRTVLRVGRQELNIGSSRLIAPSQGLNVKRSFDGATTVIQAPGVTLEGGVARLVAISPGIFDDVPDQDQDFWVINTVPSRLQSSTRQINFYYIGVDRKLSRYAQGLGPEVRHTAGTRIAGRLGRVDANYDFIFQWGKFNGHPVRAWAISTDTGVRLNLLRFPSRLGVTVNSSSGDRDPDDKSLQSFNPLFPGNSYSGVVGLLGPTNVTDLTPSLRVPVRRGIVVGVESPIYFRSSLRDGVYGIDLGLILPGQSNRYRYIGTNPGVIGLYQMTPHVVVQGTVTRFLPGKFLSDTPFRNGFGFYAISATYRF